MSYPDMALDILALIDSEDLFRPVVIGHSMGGKTAMTLGLEHPHAVGGIAVVDVAPEAYADQFTPYVTAMRGLDIASATSRKEIRQALADRLDEGAPVDFLMQNLQLRDERFDWRIHLLAVAMCMRDLCGFPEQARPKHYPGPALFIAGAQSDYLRPESRSNVVSLFPRARVQHIAGAGHWVHADQPRALTDALRTWLGETVALPATS